MEYRAAPIAALCFAAYIVTPSVSHAVVFPVVLATERDMPTAVPEDKATLDIQSHSFVQAPTYHNLRKDFSISHTTMASWLGVKRRTLYNWLNAPERSTVYGPVIEERLANLLELRNEMEPEHFPFLEKVAFSPIFGNPKFGKDIIEGKSSDKLKDWYDTTFSRFETLRTLSKKDSRNI